MDEAVRDEGGEDRRSERMVRTGGESRMKRRSVDVSEEQGVDPKDRHQRGVRGGETEEGTRSLESCLQLQGVGVSGDRHGHSGDNWQLSLVPYVVVSTTP